MHPGVTKTAVQQPQSPARPAGSRSIRLLCLEEISEQSRGTLAGELRVARLEDSPPFTALSYV